MKDFAAFDGEVSSWLDWALIVVETVIVGLGFGFSVVISEIILLGEFAIVVRFCDYTGRRELGFFFVQKLELLLLILIKMGGMERRKGFIVDNLTIYWS